MGRTHYLDLSTTPESTSKTFKTWRMEIDGEGDSNMEKIDAAYGEMAEELETTAKIDGSYDSMTVGNAEQLVSTMMVTNKNPYLFRTAGGSVDIGNREYDEIVGGTLAWNQLVQNGRFANTDRWYPGSNDAESQANITLSVANGVMTVTHNVSGAHGYMCGLSYYPVKPLVSGHKYYIAYDVRVSDEMDVGCLLQTLPAIARKRATVNEWFTFRTILESPVNGNFITFAPYAISASPIPSGATREYRNPQIVDLTVMFGPEIADRLASMESANAGVGTSWFHKLFPKDFYNYNAGELLSVNAGKHVTVGFNAYDPDSGTAKLIGGNQYQITGSYSALSYTDVNGDVETITPDGNGVFTPEESGTLTVTGGNATDTCIHLVWSGYRNDEYEPYSEHEYDLDDSLDLRGVPKMDGAGELYYDGDQYSQNGSVIRRYGIVDMGTLSFNPYLDDERGKRFSITVPGIKRAVNGITPGNIITSRYANFGYNDVMYNRVDKSIALNSEYSIVAIYDSEYTDDDTYPTAEEKIAALKASLSGVYLVYELATPTVETAQTFQNPQVVDDFGTEEYVDAAYAAGTRNVAIPVGHNTSYPANLRDKLQHLPGLADRDGDFVIRQSGRDMQLIPDTTPSQIVELQDSVNTNFAKTNQMQVLGEWNENAYIGTSGATADLENLVSYDGFRCIVIDCAPGDIFTVNLNGGIVPRAWAFVDDGGNVLSRAESSTIKPSLRDVVITAPTGAEKLVLNDRYCGLDSYSGIYAGVAVEKSGLMKPPTANGTYVLKVTVSGGTATYSWVSE